jgi:hypothetical protein
METSLTTTSQNSVKSLLLSNDKLSQALQAQDPDFVQQVFIPHSKGMGIEKAVSSKSPTFHDVSNFYEESSTLFWLRFHIAETFAFLGIYDRASVYQIRETAELILSHEIYGQLTLDEFLCFLQRFKQGRYGKIYQSARPNPQEFLQCLEPFWNELSHERGKQAERERQEQISREIHSPDNITWEQYCREKGIIKDNPLNNKEL